MAFQGISAGVPLMDFSTLGDLGKTYEEAQNKRQLKQTLASLGPNADLNQVARSLLATGNPQAMQAGVSLAHLANQDRTFGLQERQFQEQQRLHTPEYIGSVAERQAQVAQKYAPKTTDITLPSGDKVTVEKGPTGFTVPKVHGVDPNSSPSNPYAQPGKPTEPQVKDALYASRMFSAEKILRDENVIAAATNPIAQATAAMGVPGNYLLGWLKPEYQKFDQAQRNFINAVLRKESGAVIAETEFENARKQYFPQPGDTPERIEQKRQNRMDAIKGIAAGAGRSFKPETIFDPKGNLIPNPALQQQPGAPVFSPAPQIAAPGSQRPVHVRTPEEARKLPSGTPIVLPDGSLGRVP